MLIAEFRVGNEIKVNVVCDECGKSFERYKKYLARSRQKNNGKDRCRSCSAKAHPKKQNTKEYWANPEVKKQHSERIKSSATYYEGIKNRPDSSGENNSFFGHKHTAETRALFSQQRRGRIGANATAWKGGKLSVNARVKFYVFRQGWYRRVFERDSFKCTQCGSNKKIDAHHKVAISKLIKQALIGKHFETDDEKYLYLITQEDILDRLLENGVTLCRECHRKIHGYKWGSHEQ